MRTVESIRTGSLPATDPTTWSSEPLPMPPKIFGTTQTRTSLKDLTPPPRSPEPCSRPDEQPRSSCSQSYGLRVLVVDDNRIALALTTRLLQRKFSHLLASGCAASAYSGAEALHRVENEVFDVILLDVHMPEPAGPDGLTCAQAIRQGQLSSPASQANRYAHIVAVTTDCDPVHRDQYRSALFDGMIPKPVRAAHLRMFLETVEDLADSSRRSGKVPLINADQGLLPLPPALNIKDRAFFDPTLDIPPSESFAQKLDDQTRRSLDTLDEAQSSYRGQGRLENISSASLESPLTLSSAASPVTPLCSPLLPLDLLTVGAADGKSLRPRVSPTPSWEHCDDQGEMPFFRFSPTL